MLSKIALTILFGFLTANEVNFELINGSLLQFDLMLSEDGSGRGAALVAAVASRKR